jgi:hypothetical protein
MLRNVTHGLELGWMFRHDQSALTKYNLGDKVKEYGAGGIYSAFVAELYATFVGNSEGKKLLLETPL